MYVAHIARIRNVRPHTLEPSLQLGTCLGCTMVIPITMTNNQVGVYFPIGGQVSMEFAEANGLLHVRDENGKIISGFMKPDNRRIKAVRIRKRVSEGLFMPLSSLEHFGDISKLREGDMINSFGGVEICSPAEYPIEGLPYLTRNLHMFKPGDTVEIGLKLHGTSGRSMYVAGDNGYEFKTASRNVMIEQNSIGYHGCNNFRLEHSHNNFFGKLHKGETIYYEIVGYANGEPIIRSNNNVRVHDPEFIKQYGDYTTFSYGCNVGTSKIYVHRITQVNELGEEVDLPAGLVSIRCKELGVSQSPILDRFIVPDLNIPETIISFAEKHYRGPDPIDNRHIREGVVLRIINRDQFEAYKFHNEEFKRIEGWNLTKD